MNEIIVYQAEGLESRIRVKIDENTAWLNRRQIAELFGRDIKTIGKHINNALREELQDIPTVANFETVQKEGGRLIERNIEHYNLDVILSVGYRVKSKRGLQFRIWANKVLKDYLLKGYTLNNRMNRIEDNVKELSEKVNEIDLQLNTSLPPKQGIFFDGQVFDAYAFIADLIRSAKRSLILMDNYIDDTVLTHFSKRKQGVHFFIFTPKISKQLGLDIEKYNRQYEVVKIQQFNKSHDRFLVIDQKEVYHIGASLKDLGKKWFAFSKMDKSSVESILNAISDLI
jgi:hypothetical protein